MGTQGCTGSRPRVRHERGASAVEYALLVAGIAAVIALAVYAFGGGVDSLFHRSCDSIASQVSSQC